MKNAIQVPVAPSFNFSVPEIVPDAKPLCYMIRCPRRGVINGLCRNHHDIQTRGTS